MALWDFLGEQMLRAMLINLQMDETVSIREGEARPIYRTSQTCEESQLKTYGLGSESHSQSIMSIVLKY